MKRVKATSASYAALAVFVGLVALGVIADAAGAGTLLFSDAFEAWLRRHAVVVFWVAVGLVFVLALVITRLRRSRESTQAEHDDLVECLEEDVANLNARLAEVTAELEQLKQVPATHDVKLFSRFLLMFPPGGKSIEYLTNWFNGEGWDWEQLTQIRWFNNDWGVSSQFLDEDMQNALAELRTRTAKLLGEIAVNTHKRVPDEPLSILDEDLFDSYEAYHAKSMELVKRGDDVVAAHRALVRLGNEKRMA